MALTEQQRREIDAEVERYRRELEQQTERGADLLQQAIERNHAAAQRPNALTRTLPNWGTA